MRILFCGTTKGNAGPSNVNKGIVNNRTSSFVIIKSRNKYARALEIVCKAIFCDVIFLSGVSRLGSIACSVAKIYGKKTVFIMHGCGEYEVKVNHQTNMEKGIQYEASILERVDLILPVSKKYMLWVQNRYPQYAGKLGYLYNGFDVKYLEGIPKRHKKPGSVVATGADRGVKNNIVLVQAIEALEGKAELSVCGAIYHGVPQGLRFSKYTGVIPHGQFVEKLSCTELFVLNSIFESFSLSAIEALMCGCSVLISEVAGVTDLLALEETDIIHDPMDVEEIRSKIEYLLAHPNNERILSSLDIEEYSYPRQVQKLEAMCRELVSK